MISLYILWFRLNDSILIECWTNSGRSFHSLPPIYLKLLRHMLKFRSGQVLYRKNPYGGSTGDSKSLSFGVTLDRHFIKKGALTGRHHIFKGYIAITVLSRVSHDDVKWKHFPRYWPFVRRIHRSLVNSPHTGEWRGTLMFSLICVWINDWVNNREAGDLRRYRAHYDVIVMIW